MLWSFIHKWHKNIGIMSAIFVVMLSITGLMLNHTESLEMNKHFIQNKLLLDLYDIGPRQEPHGFKVGAHWIIQIGERVYFNKTQLMDDVNKLLGVVPTSEYLVVAVDNQILLLTKFGQVIERLTGTQGVPAGMRSIGIAKKGDVVIRAAHGDYYADIDNVSWREEILIEATWSIQSSIPDDLQNELLKHYRGTGLPLERIILDIHSGRLFGAWGVYVVDAAAFLFFILALSGTWMWFKRA